MSHKRVGELSWWKCQSLLGGREEKKLLYETWLVKRGDDIAVRHFYTDILTFHQNGTCTIDPNGFHTVTTMARINDMCPANVWSDRGEHFISYNGEDYEYYDGIVVDSDGRPADPSIAPRSLGVCNDVLGAEFESVQEAIESVEDLKTLKKLYRRRRMKLHVVRYCKRKYLPAFLGGPEGVVDVITGRLQHKAAA